MNEKQETTEERVKAYQQPEWVKIILQLAREAGNPKLKLENEPIKH